MLSNIFTGKTAIQIGKEAYQKGISIVLLLSSHTTEKPPNYLLPYTFFYYDYHDYYEKVIAILEKEKITMGIFTTAVADYEVKKFTEGKIPSTKLNKIDIQPTKKIIDLLREQFKDLKMVIFKYEHDESLENLENQVKEKLQKGFDYIVANRHKDISQNHAHVYTNQHHTTPLSFSKVTLKNRREILHNILKQAYGI